MKIAIIGASGKAGSLILKEAVTRGHEVTAIVRDASKLEDQNVAVIEKTILDLTSDDVKNFDVVVNAFGAPLGEEQAHVDAGHALIEALKGTNTRGVIVGGAGSLYVDENKTVTVMETPDFPDIFIPTATGQGRNLQELQETSTILHGHLLVLLRCLMLKEKERVHISLEKTIFWLIQKVKVISAMQTMRLL